MKIFKSCLLISLSALAMLTACPPPTEPTHEDYPGGGGYFPEGYTNYTRYKCTEVSSGSQPSYIEIDEFGGYEEFNGVNCKLWNFHNYDADFTHYLSYKIVDEEVTQAEGQVLCYGREKYDYNNQLIERQIYPQPAVTLQYPLSIGQRWHDRDFSHVSPTFFDLPEDLDGDGIEDTIDLNITHEVMEKDTLDLPELGQFSDCYKLNDTYTLHLYYSNPTFPFPSDYIITGTSYYRPYIGWVKTELTTNFYDDQKTLTRELTAYYVGGPTKQ